MNSEKDDLGRPEELFQSLYDAFSQAIYRFAFRSLGDLEEAADVTQESFMKLYQAVDDGGTISNPRSWIYTVAANICRDLLRRKRRDRKKMAGCAPSLGFSENETGPEVRREVDTLRRALASLDERDQLLLMLYADGLSYKELSRATGIRTTSVGKTLHRAINKAAQAIRTGEGQ